MARKKAEENQETGRVIRIESWDHLHKVAFEDAWRQPIGRYRSPLAFRGLSDSNHELTTSLQRLGPHYAGVEGHLIRNFRKYAHLRAKAGKSIFQWLALAQHHGLPTRLLDWSLSPIVAAHFATANIEKFDTDGAIWCININEAHQSLPQNLKTILRDDGALVFHIDIVKKYKTLGELDKLSPDPFLMFFEPPSLDERITNQFALFSLMSNSKAILSDWLRLQQNPVLFHKIIIPAQLKWEIRDKLDNSNINERVLFPGLDGLSQWLKRFYSSSGLENTRGPNTQPLS